MYRRRNQKQVQQQEQPVEKKEQPKKEEPVIKYAVPARGGEAITDFGYAPMLNTLRNLNYFNITGKPLSFGYLINVVLSNGYLNGDFSEYKKGSWTNTSATDLPAGTNNWLDLYTKTTNYSRSTFCAGDVIFFKTASMSFAYLIDKVYKGDENSSADSVLKYTYPVQLDGNRKDVDGEFLSSFTTCSGTVYMFNATATFKDVKSFASTLYGAYRCIEPTNVSAFSKHETSDGRTTNSTERKTDSNKYQPSQTSFPKAATTGLESQFNLTSGVIVEGWLIYMSSSVDITGDTPSGGASGNLANVVGDIIKTGPVAITTLANKTIDLGGVIKIPYKETSATDVKVHYSGNATRFASEPLNSEQYQAMYGDSEGMNELTATEVEIYSFTKNLSDKNPVTP